MPAEVRAKIGLFCNLPADRVFQNLNARSIYEVPLMLHKEGLDEKVCQLLGLTGLSCDLTEWETMVERQLNPHPRDDELPLSASTSSCRMRICPLSRR